MEKAIAYLRVSTLDQARADVSLDVQWERIEAYCRLRGLELAEVLEDSGASGSTALASRPAGSRLAAALKEHKAGHVVALKLDRLFRDGADALARTKAWDRQGAAMHLVDMGGAALDTSFSIGRMMLTMLAGFAEFERSLIAERTGACRYGWALGPDRSKLRPIGAEQGTIRRAIALRAEGLSLHKIAARLAEEGRHARSGRPFEASQIRSMLELARLRPLHPVRAAA